MDESTVPAAMPDGRRVFNKLKMKMFNKKKVMIKKMTAMLVVSTIIAAIIIVNAITATTANVAIIRTVSILDYSLDYCEYDCYCC